MQLARVRGNVVASIKAAGLASHKLLLVEAVVAASPNAATTDSSAVYVAIDLVGAGIGEIVLVTLGSAARIDEGGRSAPTDAAVIAIVDSVQFDDKTTFHKR